MARDKPKSGKSGKKGKGNSDSDDDEGGEDNSGPKAGKGEHVYILENAKMDAKANTKYVAKTAEAAAKKVFRNLKWIEDVKLIDQATREVYHFNTANFNLSAVKKGHQLGGDSGAGGKGGRGGRERGDRGGGASSSWD
jgi:hypothetical protein